MDPTIKIIDMSFAETTTTYSGTCQYLSPEILISNSTKNRGVVTPQTDMWSLGAMLLEMFSSRLTFPWDDDELDEHLCQIQLMTNELAQPDTPEAAIFESMKTSSVVMAFKNA